MQSNYPLNPFERYADDSIVHCESKAEAIELKAAIKKRMEQCGLELHPKKTKIVYCKDTSCTEDHDLHSFDFLSFCFRSRLSRKLSMDNTLLTFPQQWPQKRRKQFFQK